MTRIIVVYGLIAGLFVTTGMLIGVTVIPEGGTVGMVVGYLTMLIALSTVFVGVKRYRDVALGGIIGFWRALRAGVGIALVASVFYVVGWEIYMAATNYTFMDTYVAGALEAMRADGKSPAEIANFAVEMEAFKASYANPFYRMAITWSEIAPVALIVPLLSALILRNARAFPAKSARA